MMPLETAPGGTTPYSSFSSGQKKAILALATFAGWFSSISSFIYFPAIPIMAVDLGETTERLNLTVTSYLIVSGIIPSIVGNAADRFGRRPVLILALAVYIASNVGLALQSSFALLFFFRMAQSAGISGTYSITYGVLGDLFTPAERGGYSGSVALFLNTPPSIGPLISGLLLLRWSWRSIFWFLSAAASGCLALIIVLLPETARGIVEDGSAAVGGWGTRPLVQALLPARSSTDQEECRAPSRPKSFLNPLETLALLRFPSTRLILAAYGIGYAVYSCLQASLSSLFLAAYNVNGLASGLIYLPFGIACALSAYATGFLLDYNFRYTATKIGIVVDRKKADDLLRFPIERARLRFIFYFVSASALLVVGYGWQLQPGQAISMAGPLATQFLIGLSLQTMFTALNTLLVDLHQDCPSTAQAACNLVRCELAAALLAALDAMVRGMGVGWTFTLCGAMLLVAVVLLVPVPTHGLRWRQDRARKHSLVPLQDVAAS
ncbi:putative transporter AQR1 [Microdochium nivale]|nr:putative transporter AQR1 [Microdochium nivale]